MRYKSGETIMGRETITYFFEGRGKKWGKNAPDEKRFFHQGMTSILLTSVVNNQFRSKMLRSLGRPFATKLTVDNLKRRLPRPPKMPLKDD